MRGLKKSKRREEKANMPKRRREIREQKMKKPKLGKNQEVKAEEARKERKENTVGNREKGPGKRK